MSQALPANPNLDWLRKTAKSGSSRLRAAQPDARLHQAQLAVANDYGLRELACPQDACRIRSMGRGPTATRVRRRRVPAMSTPCGKPSRRALIPQHPTSTVARSTRSPRRAVIDAIELLVRNIRERIERPTTRRWRSRHHRGRRRAATSMAATAARCASRAHRCAWRRGFPKGTALHLAALRNQHAAVRLLVERGADLNGAIFPTMQRRSTSRRCTPTSR